jgi:hypothetical protein
MLTAFFTTPKASHITRDTKFPSTLLVVTCKFPHVHRFFHNAESLEYNKIEPKPFLKICKLVKQACNSPMASTITRIASSSSSSTLRWRYDAFLSFYGEDTRKNFTDHLHAALKQKGILVFRDDEKLERGKYVSDELLKAIQESMYAIVVISQNYAFSRWCLIELAKIVECMRDTGLTVLPIFYHVDPSHVRNQTDIFAKAFASHEKYLKAHVEMMQKWRAALSQVGSISGWHVDDR